MNGFSRSSAAFEVPVTLYEVDEGRRLLLVDTTNTLRRSTAMMLEVSVTERDLLKKILGSYLSELRQAIAATKRATAPLHAEESLVEELQKKISAVT